MELKAEFDRKTHWEHIYRTKKSSEVSWHEDVPATSLRLINELHLPLTARIFDNGAGDSYLTDHLVNLGYSNITVQDISEIALNRIAHRLGIVAKNIKWVIDDEAHCTPQDKYDLWHDRAAFHFLTDEEEIGNYVNNIKRCIKPGGYLVIATFSTEGPTRCSGLPVKQYSEESMTELLKGAFEKVKCFTMDHLTPSGKAQNFLYCTFRRTGSSDWNQ